MRRSFVVLVTLLVSTQAFALSNRCFVKSTGLDTGTCTLSSPCRSFGYALTQVSAFGEVIALDTAGYGTFSVTQSVNVYAPNGITAFIAVNAGTGIDINAASSDSVVLRGLALTSNGGLTGIDFNGGRSLSIENCIVNGFGNQGVQLARASDPSNPHIRIEGSTIRGNFQGVRTGNSGDAPPQGGPPPGIAGLTIVNSSLSENSFGISAADNTRAAVIDTVISGNAIGVSAQSSTQLSFPDVTLERCTITQSASAGVQSISAGAFVRIAYNVITGNATGVSEGGGGVIASMNTGAGGTNTIEGNATNGTFSGSYTAK